VLTEQTHAIGQILKASGDTVAVAESSTGGLIAASLLAVPGASAYFKGAAVVYTLESRKVLLGLGREDVENLKPMTEGMALAFAEKTRERLGATWGIAELGIAGPTGAPYGVPPGTSVIGIAGPSSHATTVSTGTRDREENMWAFTRAAMDLFVSAIG
jgi:PncC family amidohydrolase